MKKWQKILLWLSIGGLLTFGIMQGYDHYLKNKSGKEAIKDKTTNKQN